MELENNLAANATETVEGGANTEEQTNTVTEPETSPVTAENSEPEDITKTQAFSRRLNEERQRITDEAIKELYGNQVSPYTNKPITNRAELDSYRQMFEKEQREAKMLDSGINPTVFNEALNSALGNNPILQKAEMIIEQQNRQFAETTATQEIENLNKEFNLNLKGLEDFDKLPNVDDIVANVKKGLSLTDSYYLANRGSIIANNANTAKQQAINQVNGKAHLVPAGNEGAGGDTVVMDNDVLKSYRRLFPKASDTQIREMYKKVI